MARVHSWRKVCAECGGPPSLHVSGMLHTMVLSTDTYHRRDETYCRTVENKAKMQWPLLAHVQDMHNTPTASGFGANAPALDPHSPIATNTGNGYSCIRSITSYSLPVHKIHSGRRGNPPQRCILVRLHNSHQVNTWWRTSNVKRLTWCQAPARGRR